jgi:hypothetical protein
MTGLRGAAFARTVDRVGGTEGIETLTEEGAHAHKVSAQLQELARTNTPDSLKRARQVDRRHRRELVALGLLLALGVAWIAGNLVGYARADAQQLTVSGGGVGRHVVELDGGTTAPVDCWESGTASVWKAAPPVGWVLPYRCGSGAVAAGMPGMMSAIAAFVVLLALMLLYIARRRHLQRVAWY